jgi:hypothetical protein
MGDSIKKETLLKGRENFLAWFNRLESILTFDDIVERNNNDQLVVLAGENAAATQANEKEAKKYIVKNCSDQVMHSINPTDTFIQMIDKLHATYGFATLARHQF